MTSLRKYVIFNEASDSNLIDHKITYATFTPLYNLLKVTLSSVVNNFIIGTIFLIIQIVVAYVFGQIIPGVSSHFLDRILVKKGHGYPRQQKNNNS